ncbi:MAG: dihydroorotase [Wigglesworthia glossinidia]|nr:dihydroorotase [Wigglesworthia glossinidia]
MINKNFISNNNILTIRKPDDFHVHLRENDILKTVLPYTSRIFKRAIVMPNLANPITNLSQAYEYKKNICAAIPKNHKFEPLITCYLTENFNKNILIKGFLEKIFIAAKMYLSHTTTNSHHGINKIKKIFPILEIMQKIGMILLIHGELYNKNIDVFARESKFINNIMQPIRRLFPQLKVVLEHISTKESVDYVISESIYLGATITPHHLMFNRNDMLSEKIKPHFYCFPLLKKEQDQLALQAALSSNCNRFFLGTDSAPHAISNKECDQGFAGIFNAPIALEMYATIFDDLNILDKLEEFCSINGALFYNLPINKEKINLFKSSYKPKEKKKLKINKNEYIVPLFFNKKLKWTTRLNKK